MDQFQLVCGENHLDPSSFSIPFSTVAPPKPHSQVLIALARFLPLFLVLGPVLCFLLILREAPGKFFLSEAILVGFIFFIAVGMLLLLMNLLYSPSLVISRAEFNNSDIPEGCYLLSDILIVAWVTGFFFTFPLWCFFRATGKAIRIPNVFLASSVLIFPVLMSPRLERLAPVLALGLLIFLGKEIRSRR